MRFWVLLVFVFLSSSGALAQQCSSESPCINGACCSKYGSCGYDEAHCGVDCVSNCHLPGNISNLINQTTFDEMFRHRSDASCNTSTFYVYDAFMEAAVHFGGFGRTGDNDTRKREIAAFLAQTAYATAGGQEDSEDPYSWGYCYIKEQNATLDNYCVESTNWPCVEGEQYYGRGPIQLRYNTYYGPAGLDLDHALLFDPDELAKDSVMSFKSALWYWMNCHLEKPSCHSVMTNQWVPNSDDVQAGRVAGFGLTTNIIDGENECGLGYDERVAKRIGFYETFCDLIGVTYGENLDCYNQKPYGSSPVSKIYKAIYKIFME
ncbi:endochitinase-like [Quercus lobata]|uniref:Chitin-binding type-1 domain-containing protein n=1 Tax=Quercus lobata TaxID=97700 RepID=A0A7N2MQU9_QUELO|nr:endochitinase-like [Quercus lobata]